MQTSPIEAPAAADRDGAPSGAAPRPLPRVAGPGAPQLPPTTILWGDAQGGIARRLLLDEGALSEPAADPAEPAGRCVLIVPGEAVTLHWIELSDTLAEPQAAAAARLLLAEESAEPIADMHVAVGRPEHGLTPVALVPHARMGAWMGAAAAMGADPRLVIPSHLLLPAPESGFVRVDRGAACDWRGPSAAFSLEPELAAAIVAEAPVTDLDAEEADAALAAAIADPPMNLRQGAYGRRRGLAIEARRGRRLALLALALAALSLAVPIATLLRYTFAADAMEAEAREIAPAGPAAGGGFTLLAAAAFEAVRATPNAELVRLDYQDGALGLTVQADAPATIDALRARIAAAGLAVEPGPPRSAGGRPTADLTVRAP